jgi:hypothetical protein
LEKIAEIDFNSTFEVYFVRRKVFINLFNFIMLYNTIRRITGRMIEVHKKAAGSKEKDLQTSKSYMFEMNANVSSGYLAETSNTDLLSRTNTKESAKRSSQMPTSSFAVIPGGL